MSVGFVVMQGGRYLTPFIEPECRWSRCKPDAWVFADKPAAEKQAAKHGGEALRVALVGVPQ